MKPRKFSNVAAVHRRLVMTAHFTNPQKGKDVEALQKAINAHGSSRGITKLKVDGKSGRATVARARALAESLGVALNAPGVPMYAQVVIRNPKLRNPVQLARAKKIAVARAAEAKQKAAHQIVVRGNSVTGGDSQRARVTAAAMKAADLYYGGESHRYYSQAGAWNCDHEITGPPPDQRDDCSLFVTGMHKSADVADPNGANYTGGYTGSLAQHMTEIQRSQLRPGDLVIYFIGESSHHVEMWVGNGDGKTTYAQLDKARSALLRRTVGHGSPPVDYGDIDMMGGARFFRSLPN